MNPFIYGSTLALGLIIPLGVQNIFVFNQGATQSKYIQSMPSVITAFLCDVILILCAVFGISLIVLTIPWLINFIFILGISFLCYMGYKTWKNQDDPDNMNTQPLSAKKQIYFSASISLLNPHALLDTIGVIGTNSLQFSGHAKFSYTVACILVSLFWFFGLSVTGHFFNKMDKTGKLIKAINKISAFIMWLVAFYLSWQLMIY